MAASDFVQVKKLIVRFANFEHVKKNLIKTPLGETRCLGIFFWATTLCYWHKAFFFFECLGIQFFNSLTCGLWDAMPCQRSPTLLPREAEGFPRGDNHSKHMPLLTYLV